MKRNASAAVLLQVGLVAKRVREDLGQLIGGKVGTDQRGRQGFGCRGELKEQEDSYVKWLRRGAQECKGELRGRSLQLPGCWPGTNTPALPTSQNLRLPGLQREHQVFAFKVSTSHSRFLLQFSS